MTMTGRWWVINDKVINAPGSGVSATKLCSLVCGANWNQTSLPVGLASVRATRCPTRAEGGLILVNRNYHVKALIGRLPGAGVGTGYFYGTVCALLWKLRVRGELHFVRGCKRLIGDKQRLRVVRKRSKTPKKIRAGHASYKSCDACRGNDSFVN